MRRRRPGAKEKDMHAVHVPSVGLDVLLDPSAKAWSTAKPTTLPLMGTPVGLQPTEAIRVAWMGRKIGTVEQVSVAALHDGTNLAFRLAWASAKESRKPTDNDGFPDGAAVLLPVSVDASVMTMGAPGAAVNAWYWRGDDDRGRNVVAEGLGSSRSVDLTAVRVSSQWKGGQWQVVIARPMRVDSAEPLAALAPGDATGFAVAVWDGSNGERAGIKAFSGDWQELLIDALPTAGG
jgi:DMSO reductase family type II enzyme heme b subunit